jgi:hypothetical protein
LREIRPPKSRELRPDGDQKDLKKPVHDQGLIVNCPNDRRCFTALIRPLLTASARAAFSLYQPLVLFPAAHPAPKSPFLSAPAARTRPP